MTKQTLKTPVEYLQEPYARILTPNGAGGFTAEILEFPGCITEGDTADEAIRNLEEAALGWIEGTLLQGNEIPEPMDNEGYSGKFALRLPRSLHRAAARLAERDNVSLNTYFISAISKDVGAEGSSDRVSDRVSDRIMERIDRRLDQQRPTTVDIKVVNATMNATVNAAIYLPEEQLYIPDNIELGRSQQHIKQRKKSSAEVTRNA